LAPPLAVTLDFRLDIWHQKLDLAVLAELHLVTIGETDDDSITV